ncbi:MAG: sigma-70 family RNA polymerase sigma factor [Gemmataceae bacterium]
MLDADRLAELWNCQRERLRRMVAFRIDPRLAQRVDPSDVLQEVFLNARQRLGAFAAKQDQSPAGWLRLVAEQTLVDVHRRHLGAQQRSVERETPHAALVAQFSTTVAALAEILADPGSSPSQHLAREERVAQLEKALAGLDPIDREVLALRHYEDYSNGDVAELFAITPQAASNRYVRALRRLKAILEGE